MTRFHVFDREDYLATLPHIGAPLTLPGLSIPLFRRPIAASNSFDLMSAWPYASAPAGDLGVVRAMLVASGAVSFLSILRPDHAALPAVEAQGFALLPLKLHYVVDPALPPVPLSKKARANLRDAARVWQVERNAPIAQLAPVATTLYAELLQRRNISAIATMPPGHFAAVLAIPGIETLALRGADGEWGGLIVAACDRGETHMLHILTTASARRSNCAYLLMQAAAELWGRDGPLYLGGTPGGPDGAGIARFKSRWSNRQAPVSMLTAILDPARYAELERERGRAAFFPAYRHPEGDMPRRELASA